MSEHRNEEVEELYSLMRRYSGVKVVVNTVLGQEGCDLFELAERKPAIFEMLYDDSFQQVAELGADPLDDQPDQ